MSEFEDKNENDISSSRHSSENNASTNPTLQSQQGGQGGINDAAKGMTASGPSLPAKNDQNFDGSTSFPPSPQHNFNVPGLNAAYGSQASNTTQTPSGSAVPSSSTSSSSWGSNYSQGSYSSYNNSARTSSAANQQMQAQGMSQNGMSQNGMPQSGMPQNTFQNSSRNPSGYNQANATPASAPNTYGAYGNDGYSGDVYKKDMYGGTMGGNTAANSHNFQSAPSIQPHQGAQPNQGAYPPNAQPHQTESHEQQPRSYEPYGANRSNTNLYSDYPSAPNGKGKGAAAWGRYFSSGRTVTDSMAWLIAACSAIITAIVVVIIGWALINGGYISIPVENISIASSTGGPGTVKISGAGAPNWVEVDKAVAPSVVSITAVLNGGQEALGSGAIINSQGDVVTNHHVVNGAQKLFVTLVDKNVYPAKIVGVDPVTDLAVIKIQNAPKNLQPVSFANSSILAVGQPVMAVGNPLGLSNTATTGIISALNRPAVVQEQGKAVVTNAVQISASINPGNSGGPTFDAEGKVIGINSSILSTSQKAGSIGLGFAIPSNTVKYVADQLMKSGKIEHPMLGATITPVVVTAENMTRIGSKIVSVKPGSSAQEAGLKPGDVIIGFGGKPVSTPVSVLGYVHEVPMGESVKLSIVRNGKIINVTVKFNHADNGSEDVPPIPQTPGVPPQQQQPPQIIPNPQQGGPQGGGNPFNPFNFFGFGNQ